MKFKKSFIAVFAVAALLLQLTLTPIISLSAASGDIALDSFENITLAETETVTNDGTIIDAYRSYNGTKLTVVGTDVYNAVPNGSKALKVWLANSGGTGFYLKVKNFNGNDYTDELNTSHSLAFYIDIPANSASLDNWQFITTDVRDLWTINNSSTTSTLSDFTVTYYFKDGSKKVMENQSEIRAYDNTGAISATGFQGYISVDLKGKIPTDNDYLILKRNTTKWEGRTYYFDDFRLVGSDFAPYQVPSNPTTPPSGGNNTFTEANVAIDGFENVTLNGVTTVNDSNTILDAHRSFAGVKHTTVGKSDYAVPEGNQALKVDVAQPNDGFYIKVKNFKDKDYTTALNTSHNLAFYIDIPSAAAASDEWKIISTNNNDYFNIATTGTAIEGFTVTYYFTDGTKKVMENQSKIFACDASGNVSSTGFKGYVAIDLKNKINTDNGYLVLRRASTVWTGRVYYFDDFRLVDSTFKPYKESASNTPEGSNNPAAATSSLEDFENLADDFALKDNGFKQTRVSTTEYYSTKFAIDTEFLAQGAKSMKATLGGQGNFEFYVMLKKAEEAAPTYSDLAFYLHLPEGTYTKKDGGAFGIQVRLNDAANSKTPVDLTNAKITYYFKNGTKLEKTGEKGIFPYDKEGKITNKGFDGYVAISLAGQDLSANPYALITATETAWGTAFANNDIHFDDFRGVDAASFVPYTGENYVEEVDPEIANGITVTDFESVNPETYDPTKWDHEDSNIHCEKFYGANFSLDTNSKMQGKNSLKIGTGDQGAFQVNILVNTTDKDASRFDGIGMYVTVPMGDYLGEDNRVGYALKVGDTAMTNATVTYFFPNGKKVTKTGQDGIYSYNESGTITDDGFKGYVVVSFDSYAGIDKTNITKMVLGVTKTYKDSFKNTTIYLDDIRFVYTKTFDPFGLYSNSPNTGDSVNSTLGALAVAVIAAATLVIINRKKVFA